jgi:hypothetical protein
MFPRNFRPSAESIHRAFRTRRVGNLPCISRKKFLCAPRGTPREILGRWPALENAVDRYRFQPVGVNRKTKIRKPKTTMDKNYQDKELEKARNADAKARNEARNADPITKTPGSHPVGTGVGAVVGGAAAGAATGTMAGPVGTAVGAAVGAVVGGLAGKGIAEKIDPTVEDAYWRENHNRQPFARDSRYDDYAPAYRVGYEGYRDFSPRRKSYDEVEADLRRRYLADTPRIGWDSAQYATRAAWDRAETTYGRERRSATSL